MPSSVSALPANILAQLERFDTCSVSNAIEQFQVRTRNEGFVDGSVRCLFPDAAPTLGYAVTARARSSATPITGRCYYDRLDWWSYILSIPAPRFIAVEDVDDKPGLGALVGGIHASICRVLECNAYLTNGSVRDLPGLAAAGLQAFAGSVAVSHAYAHIVDFGQTIRIGGMEVNPGDLLLGDRHGVLSIPASIAEQVPAKAAEMLEMKKELIAYVRSNEFSLDVLAERIHNGSNKLGIRPAGDTK